MHYRIRLDHDNSDINTALSILGGYSCCEIDMRTNDQPAHLFDRAHLAIIGSSPVPKKNHSQVHLYLALSFMSSHGG